MDLLCPYHFAMCVCETKVAPEAFPDIQPTGPHHSTLPRRVLANAFLPGDPDGGTPAEELLKMCAHVCGLPGKCVYSRDTLASSSSSQTSLMAHEDEEVAEQGVLESCGKED